MPTRAYARIVSATALAAVVCALVAAPAEAAAYRYWTYWQSPDADAWAFAVQGPGTSVPADGAVEGWSFRVSEASGAEDAAPASMPDFATLCGGTAESPDLKRVGLIVDPGAAEFAPVGETAITPVATCVVIEEDATGYDVLRSVMEVRTENGLVCGLGGYPQSECAPLLDDDEVARITSGAPSSAPEDIRSATPTATDDGTGADAGTPLPTLIVAALIAAAAGIAFLWARRRRDRHA